MVEQLVPDIAGHVMALRHRQATRHRDAHVSVQAMADPASSDIGHFFDGRDVPSGVDDLVQRLGLHAVQGPHQHGPSRLPHDNQDRSRDHEPHDGICQRVAQPDANRSDEDPERRWGAAVPVVMEPRSG